MNTQRAAFQAYRGACVRPCGRITRASRTIRLPRGPQASSFSQFSQGALPATTQTQTNLSGSIPMPYITEVTAGGWRTSDIFSKLLQERIVCLNGAIDDTVSAAIVAQLLWLESDAPDKPITMYINSPGGEVSSGLAIYDTMSYIQSPVSTVCVGAAASMAAILLIGGEAGKRFALPHSSVMVHQPLGGTRGQAADILIYANQIQRVRSQVNEIVRSHLNKSFGHEKYGLQDINDMMERDKYLTPEEAKDCGIVDEILRKRPAADAGKEADQQAPKTS